MTDSSARRPLSNSGRDRTDQKSGRGREWWRWPFVAIVAAITIGFVYFTPTTPRNFTVARGQALRHFVDWGTVRKIVTDCGYEVRRGPYIVDASDLGNGTPVTVNISPGYYYRDKQGTWHCPTAKSAN